LNKLAILALSLLLFFGAMLWFLANGSLNAYIKSQIALQGEYYSGQATQLTQANFSTNSGTGVFSNLTLKNLEGTASVNAISIDTVTIEIDNNKSTPAAIIIAKITINTLQVWQEYSDEQTTNLHTLKKHIIHQLATDYPEFYPEISAKIYAKNYPDQNVELKYTQGSSRTTIKSEEDTRNAITKKLAKTSKRKRNKSQTILSIESFVINHLELNIQQEESTVQIKRQNIVLPAVTLNSIESNRLGGEILKNLFIYTLNLSKDDISR